MFDMTVFYLLVLVIYLLLDVVASGNTTYTRIMNPGNNVAEITCDETDVINITKTEILNIITTRCNKNECALSDDYKQYISSNCEGKTTCKISLDQIGPCLSKKGFITVNYTCQKDAFKCDFENGDCDFVNSSWKRLKYKEGNGHYFYVYAKNRSYLLRNKQINRNYIQCLVFYYWIHRDGDTIIFKRYNFNADVNHELDKLEVKYENGGYTMKRFVHTLEDIGNYWLVIEVTGTHLNSAFGLDDINIMNTDCDAVRENNKVKDFIPYHKSCNKVEDEIILDGCYSHFIQSEHINVIFDPLNDECIQYYAERAHAICTDSNTYTYCDARDMVKQNLSCFALRYLVIEYTCEDNTTVKPMIQSDHYSQSGNIGMVVGISIGILLIQSLTCFLVFIIYRHRKLLNKPRSQTAMNDLTASRISDGHGISLSSTNNMAAQSNNAFRSNIRHSHDTIKPLYDEYHDYSPSEASRKSHNNYKNNPKQPKLNTMSKHPDVVEEYLTLDPQATGFNRSNQNVYELASTINIDTDNHYAESEAGEYDVSGNSRHRIKEVVYDHGNDNTYDFAHQGKGFNDGEDTYDHTFGKQTEDHYDMTGF